MSIYDLELHEAEDTGEFSVTRVPGGWIYTFYWGEDTPTQTFVPWNDEFVAKDSKEMFQGTNDALNSLMVNK